MNQIKKNYQLMLDKIIKNNDEAGIRPRLLIHSCCAPCSSYVMEYLSKHFDITFYFYNPNIDTEIEFRHRAEELKRLIEDMGLSDKVKLVVGQYDPQSFYKIAKGHEKDPERGERCTACYELRIRESAAFTRKLNDIHAVNTDEPYYDYFATTLSISPLKDCERLNSIGFRIAEEFGLNWLPSDFKKREGYKRSIELSHEYNLYRQDYCGCIFSKRVDRDIC